VKPNHAFVAERSAAQHCAELLRPTPEPAALLPVLDRTCERFAKELAMMLAAFCSGEAPAVSAMPLRDCSEPELVAEIGPLAANYLLSSGVPGLNLLVSIEARAMLRMVDRAFGGSGQIPEQLPDALPLSAELMSHRLEARLASCLAAALQCDQPDQIAPLRRDSALANLAPYPAGVRLVVAQFSVQESAQPNWRITLTLPTAMLPKLLGDHGLNRLPRALAPRAADPGTAPFAAVQLTLTALLVDMQLPLTAIAELQPGSILPVAVARAVPLHIGGQTIARGTIGAQDDCVAIQITQLA